MVSHVYAWKLEATEVDRLLASDSGGRTGVFLAQKQWQGEARTSCLLCISPLGWSGTRWTAPWKGKMCMLVSNMTMANYTLWCTWGPHTHPDTCTKHVVQVVNLRRSTPLYVCCAGRRRTVNLTEGESPPALQLCLSAILTAVFNSTKIILAASCHLAPVE